MPRVLLSIFLVLGVIYIVPIIIYSLFASLVGASMPDGITPTMFLLSVLVSKIGTALAFVLLFYFARSYFSDHWLKYAFVWWLMFVLGEIGQTIGINYSWKEALAGIVSETTYLPVAAFIVKRLVLN